MYKSSQDRQAPDKIANLFPLSYLKQSIKGQQKPLENRLYKRNCRKTKKIKYSNQETVNITSAPNCNDI